MAARYRATVSTPHGPRACMQVTVVRTGRKPLIARFGGIPLKRRAAAVLPDRQPPPVTTRPKELIIRLLAGECEMCGHPGKVDVHQVGKLAHLGKPGQPRPAWASVMARKRRKTLIVCAACHDAIHVRQPSSPLTA